MFKVLMMIKSCYFYFFFIDALPRYVRVNLIKTTVESVIMTLETEDWEYVVSPATHMKRYITSIYAAYFIFWTIPHEI